MLKPRKRFAVLGALAMIVPLFAVLGQQQAAAAYDYSPNPGVIINDPLGSYKNKKKINDHIVDSIYSAPKGSIIRIASWNIRKRAVVKALVRAHQKGVTVRVLMASGNHNKRDYNRDFVYLRNNLAKGNNRGTQPVSFARLCRSSCVGPGGIMHIKMMLFSQAGSHRNIIMHGSGNLTEAAIFNQWNDLQTHVGNWPAYKFMTDRFDQMATNRTIAARAIHHGWRGTHLWVMPWQGGVAKGDPIMQALRPVRCWKGATTNSHNGRTIIRIAQTVLSGDRGLKLAKRVAQLSRQGCTVRMISAIQGKQVRKVLAAGGVRSKILTRDRNGDGIYDDYMHLKAMTIGGWYGGNRGAGFVWNGSHNWTSKSLWSDETFQRSDAVGAYRLYSRWVDRYMNSRWAHARTAGGSTADVGHFITDNIKERPDAYKNVEIN